MAGLLGLGLLQPPCLHIQPSPSSGPPPEPDFPRYPSRPSFRLYSCFSSVGKLPKARVCLSPAVLPPLPAPASGSLHFLFPLPEQLLPQILYHFFLASDPVIPQQAACPCLPRDTHSVLFGLLLQPQVLSAYRQETLVTVPRAGADLRRLGRGRDRAGTLLPIL